MTQPEATYDLVGDADAFDGVFKPIEGTSFFRFDHEAFLKSMPAAARRNHLRHMKVLRIQSRILRWTPWLTGPLLGLVTTFWICLIDEGWRNTFHPWGAIGFSYLNDGIKPSLWHTWQQVMHPGGKYDGIWVSGAPRNKAEADGES